MNYGLLIGLCPIAGIVGICIGSFICGFIQTLYELRGESIPNANRLLGLLAVLVFPLWIIIWLISYCIFNNYY